MRVTLLLLLLAGCADVVAGTCSSDSDCRVEADYCTSCDCRALTKNEKVPECKGPGVRCFADPCGGKVGKCDAGKCTAAAAEAK